MTGKAVLLERLKNEQARLIHSAAEAGTDPGFRWIQRVARLEGAIAAIEFQARATEEK